LSKGHRYPAEIIAHCVWLHHRFPLSFREVEQLMLQRGGRQEVLPRTPQGPGYLPRVIVTDKRASYQVAHRELVLSVAHRRPRYLNKSEG
jgi:transposase-like protein